MFSLPSSSKKRDVSSDVYDSSFLTLSLIKDEKTSFFGSLDDLEKSSGEDEDADADNFRNVLRSILPKKSSRTPGVARPPTTHPKRIRSTAKQLPAVQRTISAPVSETIAETPPLQRTTSLLRYDISAEGLPELSFTRQPLSSSSTQDPKIRGTAGQRTVSTPSIGSVSMTNSLGIANMLKKNSRKEVEKSSKGVKRKSSAIEMKPESEQFFKDKIFYYIPDNDVAPLRKTRIMKAQSYGAEWTKDWTSSITHIIVDVSLTFEQIKKWLLEQKKVRLVSEFHS